MCASKIQTTRWRSRALNPDGEARSRRLAAAPGRTLPFALGLALVPAVLRKPHTVCCACTCAWLHSSIIPRLHAGMSSGLRLVTRLWSTTT
jgi:hypothetical protein